MAAMLYHDRIYGGFEINQPVLIDLLQTRAMQRLQGVLQHGVTALIGITRPTTRLEHSVGVMWLVTHFGGSLEEQIAALLHDVSHTAFSHVIDYVVHNHDDQSYHEEMKEPFLAASDIPTTLQRYGYAWRAFLHEDDYALLEQPAPALCADRLDYFLRDSRDLGLATDAEIQSALDHLIVRDGRLATDDVEAARWLAYTYLAADQQSWANFREVGLYELAARAIRLGLQIGLISEADFFSTDEQLWAKLQASDHVELRRELSLVSPQTRFEWDVDAPTFWVSTKLRTIDPDVLIDGRLVRLSELDADFAQVRADYHQRNSGRWPMRVIA